MPPHSPRLPAGGFLSLNSVRPGDTHLINSLLPQSPYTCSSLCPYLLSHKVFQTQPYELVTGWYGRYKGVAGSEIGKEDNYPIKWHEKIKDNKNQSPIPIWACHIKDLGSVLLSHPPPIMGNNLVVSMFVCMHVCDSSEHKLGTFNQILFHVLFFNPQTFDPINEPPP